MRKSSTRRFLSIIICLSMVIAILPLYAVSAADDVQVGIVNPGFELDLIDGQIQGWSKDVGTIGLIELSDTVAKSGSNSLHLHDTDSSTTSPGLRVLSDKIAVIPDATYTVTASVYTTEQTASIVHEVQYFNANNIEITPRQQVLNAKTALTLNTWNEIKNVSIAPATAVYARIGFYSGKPSLTNAYFDDIFIESDQPTPGLEDGLVNPSFDLGIVEGQIQGWAVDESTAAYGSIELSQTHARTGSNSLLFWDKTAGAQPTGHYRVLSNAIPAAEGDPVSFSIHVYKENAADQSHGVQPVIHYYNEAGVQVKANDFVNYGKDTVTVGEWYDLTVTGTAPAGTAYIKVGLYSGFINLTKVYADDAVVIVGEEEPVAPGPELTPELTNPGFEDNLIDGSIPGWTSAVGTGDMSLATNIFKSGSRSLYFKDASTTSGFRVLGEKFTATPGNTLVITSNVYVISQTHNIVSEIYYYNASDVEIGSNQSLFSGVSLGTEKWSTMRLLSTVPANTAYARIALYSGDPSLTEAYFDDVSYEVLEPEVPLNREYAAPEDLGAKVYVNLGQAGAVQTNANGENEAYFVTNGKPGTFFVVDGETGKLKFQYVIPNTIATWAMTIDENKNVYFSGTEDGNLYRYLPVEEKVEKLGFNQTDSWVWDLEAIDDKIYGATYNTLSDGKLFEYNITTGQFRSYGVVDAGQHYVRGIAVDEQYIYAALGATGKLFKIDRVSGVKTEILVPGYSGTTGIMADVYIHSGKLFVSVSTANMVVMDLETLEVEASFQQSAMISEPAPYDSNLIYFKYLTTFYQYDIAAKAVTEVVLPFPVPDTGRVKDYAWITMNSGEKMGQTVLAMLTQYGEYILIDPTDKWMQFIELEIDAQPVNIQSLERGSDGRIYLGGYQRGMSIYNPFTSNIDVSISSFAQPEGIGFLNDKVYYGTYVSSIMYSYDPTKEVELNVNPKLEFDAQHQDRPFAITSGDNKLFVGTVADYGFLEGALLIFDEATNTWTQHDNVVENQSIIALAYKDGLLYGSTSVWGGLGVDPSESKAVMFVWDVARGEKIDEFTLDDLLIDETPRMIGGLKFGPDGLLWGVVDGTVFAMDVTTKSIVKSKMIQPSLYNSSKVMSYKLEFAPDGLLYTTLSRKIFAIDPVTLQYKVVSNSFVNVMTLGIDGSIYYAPEAGTNLSRIAIPQTDATLSAITINGEPLEGFTPGILAYSHKPSPNAIVQATTTQEGATVLTSFDQAAKQTIIHVTGTDGKSTLVYKINWKTAQSAEPADPGTPGTPATPANPNAQKIGKESLEVNEQGKVSIEIQKDMDSVLLPLNAAAIVGQQSIVLTNDDFTVELAPEVLEQLQQLASSIGGLQDAEIKFSFAKVSTSDKQDLFDEVRGNHNVDIVEAGEVFEFILEIVAKDGSSIKLTAFDKPIQIKLNVNKGNGLNPDLVGIYYIDNDGKLTYIGGKLDNGSITADIHHFSKYAVLEINKSFTDVPTSHWASSVIKSMAAKLIAEGVSATEFAPDQHVTRAEFVALIARTLGLESSSMSKFSDIEVGAWYTADVTAAYEAGIVSGMSETLFAPNRTMTREEMAVILLRTYEAQQGKKSDASYISEFADSMSFSTWASSAINTTYGLGLVNGRGDDRFVPQGHLTRAEAIQAIASLLSKNEVVNN